MKQVLHALHRMVIVPFFDQRPRLDWSAHDFPLRVIPLRGPVSKPPVAAEFPQVPAISGDAGTLAVGWASLYAGRVDVREAAQRWAEVWQRGWPEHDAAAIAALYAEDAFWQQHPFHDPEPGYLARVFAEEESAQCQFGTPLVDGDRAAVPWSARTRLADGGTEDLAGVSLLRFGDDGLVVEERDFWAQR